MAGSLPPLASFAALAAAMAEFKISVLDGFVIKGEPCDLVQQRGVITILLEQFPAIS